MNAQDINQTFDLLTLAQGDTDLKPAGRYLIGACPFCGGTDRFNLAQKENGWRWLCRHCTEAKYKTPIDYVMRRDGLDFKQAFARMGGTYTPTPRPRLQLPAIDSPALLLPDENWQAQRWHEVTQASESLLASKPARAYLEARALDLSMWEVFLLGYGMIYDPHTKTKRPAIVIPWWDTDETITAIKYRFIDDLARDKDKRYTMAKGSKQILFGLHLAGGNETLILIEGEINAVSVRQAATRDELQLDVLSFGSETATHANILQAVAEDYQSVIVWADDPAHANTIRLSLSRPAAAICSPEIDGLKYDANMLLQKGYLAQFLLETTQTPQGA